MSRRTWALVAGVAAFALSTGNASAQTGQPPVPPAAVVAGGDCESPLLAASYEFESPCVPFDFCTGSTTLWTVTPCTEGDRIAQCVEIVERFESITDLCSDLTPLLDVCGPDGTRRWSVAPCDFVAEIGEPQVIDPPGVLPKTGAGSTLTAIAALLTALGLACLAVRSAFRDMDEDGPL